MNCNRKEGTPPDIFECTKCGRPMPIHPSAVGLPVYRNCERPGIGDIVAAGIELSGIGPLYRRLRGGECSRCKKNQAALNELGKRVGL